nr:sigma-70 family RNA polymerase sigma factor [Sphingomicrobium sediminis]
MRGTRAFDAYLVAAVRAGDRRAAKGLVERWQPRLTGHAHRLLGEAEAARDCVQAGWVEIWRSLPRLREERAFGTFAYRIVSRQCAQHVSRVVKRRSLAEELAAEPLPEPVMPVAGSDAEKLSAAMAALPGAMRAAVALFYTAEMSVAEVAVALDIPVGTVKSRLSHARAHLRAAFEGDV